MIEILFFTVGVIEGLIFGIAITLQRLRKKPIIGKKGTYYFTKSEGGCTDEEEKK